MFYRIYQPNNQVYPSWGYNLSLPLLKRMTIAYLESLFEQHSEENDLDRIPDVEALNEKTDQLATYNENQLIEYIQGYLSQWDGELEVEKSNNKFLESECDTPSDLIDGCYEGSDESWFTAKNS